MRTPKRVFSFSLLAFSTDFLSRSGTFPPIAPKASRSLRSAQMSCRRSAAAMPSSRSRHCSRGSSASAASPNQWAVCFASLCRARVAGGIAEEARQPVSTQQVVRARVLGSERGDGERERLIRWPSGGGPGAYEAVEPIPSSGGLGSNDEPLDARVVARLLEHALAERVNLR